jgi:hypothetical protein
VCSQGRISSSQALTSDCWDEERAFMTPSTVFVIYLISFHHSTRGSEAYSWIIGLNHLPYTRTSKAPERSAIIVKLLITRCRDSQFLRRWLKGVLINQLDSLLQEKGSLLSSSAPSLFASLQLQGDVESSRSGGKRVFCLLRNTLR